MSSSRRWSFALALAAFGCVTPAQRHAQQDLDAAAATLTPLPTDGEQPNEGYERSPSADERLAAVQGHLDEYRAIALSENPTLRASYERWRAAAQGPAAARRMPETVISYGGFIRAVETRVGPQRHKLGVMQWLPWPTTITAKRDAASAMALAEQRRFEASALEVTARVDRAYWSLWSVREEREVLARQRVVLDGLARQMEAGITVGRSDVADASRLALAVSRLDDRIAALQVASIRAEADLLASLGSDALFGDGPNELALPTIDEPPDPSRPRPDATSLVAAAVDHPEVERLSALAQAELERARAAKARNAPSLGLGVDWVIVAEGDAMAPDAGKDAVIAMASIKVPLSFGATRAETTGAEARSAAHRADAIATRQRLAAAVHATLARIDDAGRRVALHEKTLIPQATAAFDAVSANYVAGRGGVADLLLAEREVIELEVGQLRALSEHAMAWADLQALVGAGVDQEGA